MLCPSAPDIGTIVTDMMNVPIGNMQMLQWNNSEMIKTHRRTKRTRAKCYRKTETACRMINFPLWLLFLDRDHGHDLCRSRHHDRDLSLCHELGGRAVQALHLRRHSDEGHRRRIRHPRDPSQRMRPEMSSSRIRFFEHSRRGLAGRDCAVHRRREGVRRFRSAWRPPGSPCYRRQCPRPVQHTEMINFVLLDYK